MWLKKVLWYLLLLLKYWVAGAILTVIIALFFPQASLIVGILFLIGSFTVALTDYKEKVLPRLEARHKQTQLNRVINQCEHEFEGFNEMVRTIKRGI